MIEPTRTLIRKYARFMLADGHGLHLPLPLLRWQAGNVVRVKASQQDRCLRLSVQFRRTETCPHVGSDVEMSHFAQPAQFEDAAIAPLCSPHGQVFR